MAVRQRGKNTFLIRVHIGRDPITKKRIEINETVRGSRSYAEKREAELKAKKLAGQLIKSPLMTLDTLFNRNLDSIRHTHSPVSRSQYWGVYRCYAQPYFGNISIDKIRHSDVIHLFNFLLDPKKGSGGAKDDKKTSRGLGLSPGTVKNVRTALKFAFNFAVADRLIAENPVSGTSLPACGESIGTSLTVGEARAFVSVKEHIWYGNALAFQLYAGLRNEEVMALIWDDVDFEKGTLPLGRA